jgi:deoxyribose-phosphate aldolase
MTTTTPQEEELELFQFIKARARIVAENLEAVHVGSSQPLLPLLSATEPTTTDKDEILAEKVEKGEVWVGEFVDHTLLKPTATKAEIELLVQEALTHRFTAVCVNGTRVGHALEKVKDSSVKVAAVIGFPLGAVTTTSKAAETRELVKLGAQEIDMVVNMGLLKDGDYTSVRADVAAVVAEATASGALVKVILECGALTREEIADASLLSVIAGAQFIKVLLSPFYLLLLLPLCLSLTSAPSSSPSLLISSRFLFSSSSKHKTSTGFGFGGAKLEDVKLMSRISRSLTSGEKEVLVKASGGVRTWEDSIKMIRAGARRIGTSSGVAIAADRSAPQSSAPSGY